MNRHQYIAALKHALRGMKHDARDEIVREIETHIKEMPTEASLLDRFGTPEELACRYLEGEYLPPSAGARAIRLGKTFLVAAGSIVLVAVVATVAFISYWSRDEFDYSDEAAAELSDSTWDWHQADWKPPLAINTEQARSIFYWHTQNSLKWHCDGNSGSVGLQEGVLEIRHDDCVVYLPQHMTTLNVRQGGAVLVRPQANIKVNVTQGKLRIAENDAAYRYEINAVRSDIKDFKSDDSASVLVNIDALESEVALYEY